MYSMNILKHTLLIAILLTKIGASAQLSDDPQYFLQWSDEFGDPHHLTGDTFNLSGNKTSSEQIQWLHPRWDYSTTDYWCNDLTDTKTNGNPTTEVSYGTLKLRMVRRDTPIVEYLPTWCNGDKNPTGKKIRRYDKENMMTRHITPTKVNKFNYGFYELKFRLPPVINSSSDGIQFSRYQYIQDVKIYRPNSEGFLVPKKIGWAEVDFIEYSGIQDRFTHNYLFGYNDKSDTIEFKGGWPSRYMNQINFKVIKTDNNHLNVPLEEYADFRTATDLLQTPDENDYHIMSCEVTPQKITYYMDGIYLQSTVGQHNVEASLPDLPFMSMTLGLHTNEGFDADYTGTTRDDTIKSSTILPYQAEVDYVRFYKFNSDKFTRKIEDPSQVIFYPLSELSSSVYQSIAIGPDQFTSNSRINSASASVVLRAEEEIELLPGFEVSIGGEFYADVHQSDR